VDKALCAFFTRSLETADAFHSATVWGFVAKAFPEIT